MMFDPTKRFPRLLFAICMAASLLLTGCGQSPTNQLWDELETIHTPIQEMSRMPQVDPDYQRTMHENTANALERALGHYRDMDPALRQLLEEMRDNERRLAAGEISGAEADQIRQRHQEYWSQLERRQVPSTS